MLIDFNAKLAKREPNVPSAQKTSFETGNDKYVVAMEDRETSIEEAPLWVCGRSTLSFSFSLLHIRICSLLSEFINADAIAHQHHACAGDLRLGNMYIVTSWSIAHACSHIVVVPTKPKKAVVQPARSSKLGAHKFKRVPSPFEREKLTLRSFLSFYSFLSLFLFVWLPTTRSCNNFIYNLV